MAHDHGSHSHGEGHGHGHAHGEPSTSRAFVIGIALNLTFVIVEAVFGVLSHSMALVADAGHNLSDVLGLALSLGAMILAKRAPSRKRTYGLRGTTILASLANAVVLLVVTGGVVWESVRRLADPAPAGGTTIIVVALAGVMVNGISALLFMRGRKGDLNVRSAFVHLASDAALALGVAVAGGVMLFTHWWWLDPAVSIALSLVILAGTWSLLKSALHSNARKWARDAEEVLESRGGAIRHGSEVSKSARGEGPDAARSDPGATEKRGPRLLPHPCVEPSRPRRHVTQLLGAKLGCKP